MRALIGHMSLVEYQNSIRNGGDKVEIVANHDAGSFSGVLTNHLD
jgi:hypothetical protein